MWEWRANKNSGTTRPCTPRQPVRQCFFDRRSPGQAGVAHPGGALADPRRRRRRGQNLMPGVTRSRLPPRARCDGRTGIQLRAPRISAPSMPRNDAVPRRSEGGTATSGGGGAAGGHACGTEAPQHRCTDQGSTFSRCTTRTRLCGAVSQTQATRWRFPQGYMWWTRCAATNGGLRRQGTVAGSEALRRFGLAVDRGISAPCHDRRIGPWRHQGEWTKEPPEGQGRRDDGASLCGGHFAIWAALHRTEGQHCPERNAHSPELARRQHAQDRPRMQYGTSRACSPREQSHQGPTLRLGRAPNRRHQRHLVVHDLRCQFQCVERYTRRQQWRGPARKGDH